MTTDPNLLFALFILVVCPVVVALSIPVLAWLEK